jgi:mRNA interferase RelE/StbE
LTRLLVDSDRATLRRVKTYLDAVCELDDPRQRGKGLTGELAGWWYRVGDWRVIVEIRDQELVVIAIGLGHRAEIYREP